MPHLDEGHNIYRCFNSPTGSSIHMLGPDLKHGPLPAAFYFALSGNDSLTLDPFNQPALFLTQYPIRVFSFTIPGHGQGLDNTKAMAYWASEIAKGNNIIYKFIEECSRHIDYLAEEGYLNTEFMGALGLSRGGFIAGHLAAMDPRIRFILGFAPLTRLDVMEEFKSIENESLVKSLALIKLVEKIQDRQLRFYIGNHDIRVGTDHCFEFIKELTDTAYNNWIHPPLVEMVISPSIGHNGHGTSPETFKDGADWLGKKLIS